MVILSPDVPVRAAAVAEPCIVDINGGGGSLAVTGLQGDFTVLVAGAIGMIVISVFVLLYRRRATRRADTEHSLADSSHAPTHVTVLMSLLLVALCALPLAAPASSARAATTDSVCDMFTFDIDIDKTDARIGSSPDVVQVLTIRNISNFPIALRLSVPVKTDPDGLGPHVAVFANCGCSTSPMLNTALKTGTGPGNSVILAAGATTRITVSMNMLSSITNAQQRGVLDYGLTVYADQVPS
ncbi:hypothetical protein FHX49_002008 [Microbacterium endophyticum]|uniref:Uncharacterized protein n=1 Tax=Microbacterium endophyticum TaxID=1526412 RepID=A0A7W4YMQ5_9MICO|nr:hypothetical protein [Microbacterium endophyticum]MBB2976433.1 hypothetical protein [Microbacterium endophyticum]NIK35879.1 hypothetical protein [Microbacterium endophyticum]